MHEAAISFFGMLGTLWPGKKGLIDFYVKKEDHSYLKNMKSKSDCDGCMTARSDNDYFHPKTEEADNIWKNSIAISIVPARFWNERAKLSVTKSSEQRKYAT